MKELLIDSVIAKAMLEFVYETQDYYDGLDHTFTHALENREEFIYQTLWDEYKGRIMTCHPYDNSNLITNWWYDFESDEREVEFILRWSP